MSIFTREKYQTHVYYKNVQTNQFQTWLREPIPYDEEVIIELNIFENNYCKIQTALYETGKTNEYFTIELQGTGLFQAKILNSKIEYYLNGTLIQYLFTQNHGQLSFFIKCPEDTILDFKYNQLKIYPIISND
ncbi:MAG: hypothetical protein IJF83_06055 [Methanobrevibacter sp.]|nr:hypothetical protein [Methanobrevibacter sp.]